MPANSTNSDDGSQIDVEDQLILARERTRIANEKYVKEADKGNSPLASALGDQAQAALKEEESLIKRLKPPRHRK